MHINPEPLEEEQFDYCDDDLQFEDEDAAAGTFTDAAPAQSEEVAPPEITAKPEFADALMPLIIEPEPLAEVVAAPTCYGRRGRTIADVHWKRNRRL